MLKWLRWKLLGRITIVLVDADRSEHKRIAKKVNGIYTTRRFGDCPWTKTWLLPKGGVQGPSYVESWRSIYPPFLHLPEGPW